MLEQRKGKFINEKKKENIHSLYLVSVPLYCLTLAMPLGDLTNQLKLQITKNTTVKSLWQCEK